MALTELNPLSNGSTEYRDAATGVPETTEPDATARVAVAGSAVIVGLATTFQLFPSQCWTRVA